MKNKISILAIAIVLTIILFALSTYLQRKLINYEPMIKCFVASDDVEENEKISYEKMKEVDIPIPLVINMRIVKNKEELDGLYASSKIYAGQILVKNQFDTKENLSIFEAENGKEKISIKIKSAENGVSYKIKENSKVNIYVTMRAEYAKTIFEETDKRYMGNEDDGYCSIKILSNVTVLGVFDSNGTKIEGAGDDYVPDTIMICVLPEEAATINLIRDFATFNITEM